MFKGSFKEQCFTPTLKSQTFSYSRSGAAAKIDSNSQTEILVSRFYGDRKLEIISTNFLMFAKEFEELKSLLIVYCLLCTNRKLRDTNFVLLP